MSDTPIFDALAAQHPGLVVEKPTSTADDDWIIEPVR